MMGLPPFLGFFSKFFVFNIVVETQNYILFFFSFIVTVFSSFYYLRMAKLVFSERYVFKDNYIYFLTVPKTVSIVLIFVVVCLTYGSLFLDDFLYSIHFFSSLC